MLTQHTSLVTGRPESDRNTHIALEPSTFMNGVAAGTTGHAAVAMMSATCDHRQLKLVEGWPVTSQQVQGVLSFLLPTRLCQNSHEHSAHVLICKPAVIGLHTRHSCYVTREQSAHTTCPLLHTTFLSLL